MRRCQWSATNILLILPIIVAIHNVGAARTSIRGKGEFVQWPVVAKPERPPFGEYTTIRIRGRNNNPK